jgi:hemerythrin
MTMDPEAASASHLGRPELDPEHQGQIDLLLAVEAELRGARDPAQLSRLLDGLVEYTNIHFMSEQLIMRQHVYPGLPAHEAEHDQLMEQMRDFQKRIGSGERTLVADDLSALRDWVLRHIRTKDTAFAQFLADNV